MDASRLCACRRLIFVSADALSPLPTLSPADDELHDASDVLHAAQVQDEARRAHLRRRQRGHERGGPRRGQSGYSQVRARAVLQVAEVDPPERRGCETWVVREGYEGLVRGNGDEHKPEKAALQSHKDVHIRDETFVHNLRFGDGELLRDGTSDHPSGRTLKGRYIVRVGWDDVRGWFGVVSLS